jgi:plasmid replication initiation protein
MKETNKSTEVRLFDIHKDALIRQANSLVEARYKLSLNEQKIVMMMATMIKKDDENFTRVRIKLQDFIDAVGTSHHSTYEDIKKFAKGLKHKDIEIEDEERWLLTGWIVSFEYLKKEQFIELEFSPKLRPWLLELQKSYTKYQLKYAMHLRSFYAIRIYLLLKQFFPRIPERTFELNELRSMLGIEKNEYKNFNDFTRRIIIPAKKDLTDNADIAFEYEPIKTERKKIGRVKFIIQTNVPKPKQCVLVLPPSQLQLVEQSQEEENRKTEYYNALPDEKKNAIEMQIDERIVKENPAYSDNLRNENDPVLRNMRYVYRIEIIDEMNKKAASS